MNFTVQISNSSGTRTEIIATHNARNWQEALKEAMDGRWWASKGTVTHQNGKPLNNSLLAKL